MNCTYYLIVDYTDARAISTSDLLGNTDYKIVNRLRLILLSNIKGEN